MLRVGILAAVFCVYCGMLPSIVSETVLVNTRSSDAPLVTTDSSNEIVDLDNKEQERYYHPAEDKNPRVLEEFNRQFLDGSYEYKYVLSNGVTRYEKSYWKHLGKGKKLLARKGFYSHPLPNYKYLTVFYTADEHGFQQDTTKYTNTVPTLPKHLDVPQLEFPQETSTFITTTTTRKPTTTRKITTHSPKATTTQRPAIKPSKFNWIY